jgi:hypothetical protein
VSRTKRKGLVSLNRYDGYYFGNKQFEKDNPHLSQKHFEENPRKYGRYICKCEWCMNIVKKRKLKAAHKKEIENFRKGIE